MKVWAKHQEKFNVYGVQGGPPGCLRHVAMSVGEKLKFRMIAELCVAQEPGKVDDSKEYEAEVEETAQVKEVKTDFESPGTAPTVLNSDQKSLFQTNLSANKFRLSLEFDNSSFFIPIFT